MICDCGEAFDQCDCRWTSVKLKPLSYREHQILELIMRQQKTMHRSPSMREICDHIGSVSPHWADDLLRSLARKGYIARDPLKSRAIRVLAGPQ